MSVDCHVIYFFVQFSIAFAILLLEIWLSVISSTIIIYNKLIDIFLVT